MFQILDVTVVKSSNSSNVKLASFGSFGLGAASLHHQTHQKPIEIKMQPSHLCHAAAAAAACGAGCISVPCICMRPTRAF